jgi:hypothetical protein
VVEWLGLVGLALGAGLAATDQRQLPEALTVAVAALAAAAGPGRRGYLWAGAAAAVAATWAWLAVADVAVLEAYTLPAAVAALAAGLAARLPRWATIGGSGLLLLWLGATAERRLARLRRLRRRFQDLEPGGAAPGPG